MSVQLCELRGGVDFEDVEVMAPDLDVEFVWLWMAKDGDARIDLSREQCRELRDALNEILSR
jgi:hypothetical protein